MKIVVLVKQTADTEASINTTADGTKIDESGMKFIVNPYDEFAIEEALKIKTAKGGGEVVVASFGNDGVKDRVLKGLAMGADRGLIISNDGFEQADALVVSKVLAAAIASESPDLVLCGKQAIDDDNMHVGVMTAERLDWPHVNVVSKMDFTSDNVVRAEREVEGGQVEVFDVELPAVFGANKSLNSPRYASLPGIMKAKKKPMDRKTPSDLGLDVEALKGVQRTQVDGYEYPKEKPAGKVFQGETVDVMVDKVLNLLREEAKVL